MTGMVAACSTASAAPPPKNLWATVDVCNTAAHPDQMGVIASMPGDGNKRERMFVRFRAQFYDATKKKWFALKDQPQPGSGLPPVATTSGWRPAGSASQKAAELGWYFTVRNTVAGSSSLLRGVVDFQWREKRRTKTGRRTVVLRTLHANTKGQHSTHDGDPPGYSSGTCEIT
ncbi:MAG TPA: hypothetical protein VGF74_03810 [Thermoleophilaceae bacterium]